MKKIVFAIIVSVFFISCKSQKTNIYTSKNDTKLNYNNEAPNNQVQVVNTSDIDRTLTDYLRGVAGVRVKGDGANATITIRGERSLSLSNEPIFIIDGREYRGSFASLYYLVPGDQIRSVTVLKDASTLGMYGSNAANGVIEIITKQ